MTLLVALTLIALAQINGQSASVWLTTKDKQSLLAKQADVPVGQSYCDSTQPKVSIGTTTLNVIDGFGAAMTDSSAWVLDQLNKSQPAAFQQLMKDLFDPANGIGISFLRVTISACDFSLNDYTYDDTSGDTSLSKFSIAHDQAYIIPVLKSAKALNSNLKLLATPWTAPVWMKTGGQWGSGTLQDSMYDVYANFWVDALKAYQSSGLPFYAFTPQNEPLFEPGGYPGMGMSSTNATNFVLALGPKLKSNNIDAKYIVYDHNWDNYQYPIDILNNPTARQYVAGSAFHCYGGQPSGQSNVHNAYPDKEIYFTECSGTGTESTSDFGNNLMWSATNLYIGGMANWARTVVHWNLALDTSAGPQNGGCSNCRGVVTVDYKSGSIVKNSEYYNIAQASKFIQPGASRLEISSSGSSVNFLAFKNPDGSYVLYSSNDSGNDQKFVVSVPGGGGCFNYTLKPGIGTFVWK